MKIILTLGALGGFAVAALGFGNMRSDIQLLIGFVGLFSGLMLLGIATLLQRLDGR